MPFLANVNSCSRSLYMLSPVRLSSVTLERPTQPVEIFGNFFFAVWYLGHPLTSTKNGTDRPRGTPPTGDLNARGVAKYSDFSRLEFCFSETVQDRR